MEEVKYIPGDLVKFKDKVQAITNIDRETSYRIEISMENGICVCKPEDIETHIRPVKLTPEIILKQNGWEQWWKGKHFYRTHLGENADSLLYLYLWDIGHGGGFIVRVGEDMCTYYKIGEIQYVHQLQHLLFVLGLDSNLKV